MKFKPLHHNHNVADLGKAMAFYREALGLTEVRRLEAADGSYTIVFLGTPEGEMQIELTCLQDHPGKYDLGKTSSISASGWMTFRPPMPIMKKWAASATKTPLWASTSLPTRMATG